MEARNCRQEDDCFSRSSSLSRLLSLAVQGRNMIHWRRRKQHLGWKMLLKAKTGSEVTARPHLRDLVAARMRRPDPPYSDVRCINRLCACRAMSRGAGQSRRRLMLCLVTQTCLMVTNPHPAASQDGCKQWWLCEGRTWSSGSRMMFGLQQPGLDAR